MYEYNGELRVSGHYGTDLEAHLAATRFAGKKTLKRKAKFMDLADLCSGAAGKDTKPSKRPRRSMPNRCIVTMKLNSKDQWRLQARNIQ